MLKMIRTFTFVLSISIITPFLVPFHPDVSGSAFSPTLAGVPVTSSWIVKWKESPDPDFFQESRVLRYEEPLKVWEVRPLPGINPEAWRNKWSNAPGIAYLQPNHPVQIAARPNDPTYSAQTHLKWIGAESAWEHVRSNTFITIAVVDTGVDLDHPDLKSNLVKGTNLLDEDAPPEDDHGHGTNVAGVLAAAGNNRTGISGVLWNARIMPIKALDAKGLGDEMELGAGIRYAVDHGADIVVLSVGLYKYSPFMEEVVQYAEQKGVLVVAASGNDGKQVKYPSAYPSVLTVGGMGGGKQVHALSNYGPEMDVVAPWKAYTTTMGGGYTFSEGTSMAAPQVAGAAALILAKYPDMKPFEVRNLIRQTAEDLGQPGWDEKSGYGLLRVDRALETEYSSDLYEPNNSRNAAKPFPVSGWITAETEPEDRDWFHLKSPYPGEVRLEFDSVSRSDLQKLKMTYYEPGQSEGAVYSDLTRTIRVPVTDRSSYLVVETKEDAAGGAVRYDMTSRFQIAPDPFENNDRQYMAYALPSRTQSIKGNFHQLNDADWFVLHVQEEATMRIELSTDSFRIDPELWIQRQGEQPEIIDNWQWGETEYSGILDVEPGTYYLRTSNVISEKAYPEAGEYQLDLFYSKKFGDPNEPNNRAYQATSIIADRDYRGVLYPQDDRDWFSFQLQKQSYVTLELKDIPSDRMMSLTLYDSRQKEISIDINKRGIERLKVERLLDPGTYFVRLNANEPFRHQQYRLNYTAEPLLAGFRDISGHWAQEEIRLLAEDGVVSGYDDYTFRPNRTTTRAEAVMMISKAVELPSREAQAPNFRDIGRQHWAFEAIRVSAESGIVQGYPDGTFRPGRSLTRLEMTVMAAKALGLEPLAADQSPFSDLPVDHWGFPLVARMVEEGWITGYPAGTFRADQPATRAELASLLQRIRLD